MLRLVKSRSAAVVAMFVAATVTLCSGVALAVWSSTSTTSISSPTDALSTPSLGAVTGVSSSGATINWSDPGSWQSAATYTATATASGHTTQSCNALASALSCSLTGLDAGTTYSVSVTGKLNNWVSSAATTTVTPTAADTTAPTSAITFPASAGNYNAAGWTAGCNASPFNATDTICGTASDNVGGSGLKSVAVSVQATSGTNSGKYWDPASPAGFKNASEVKMSATVSSGNWTLAFPAANLTDAAYTVRVYATDNANNTQASATSASFTYDTTAPTGVAVTAPSANAVVSGTTVTVTGTASDASLSSIQLQYKLHTASTWTNIGSAGSSSPASATWDVSALTDGAYDLRDVATDMAGNQTISSTVAVSVANAAQPISLAITNKSGGTAGRAEAGDTIAVAFSTPLQTASMCSAASWASPAGDTTSHTLTDVVVTYNKGTGGNNDSITFGSATCPTFRFGTIQLDAGGGIYSSGSTGLSFTGSTLSYSYSAATGNSTVTVVLGTLASGTPVTATANHTATWTATSGLKGTSGAALSPASKAVTAELF